ncbi:hypothetical protein SeMB42_g03190 [Synchytrium endobioticum]|uniref:2-oxoisovalerate dehydrogenase subunit alpha n=1 Tax=Synchytrium endobioticum TaxID=286115 RepID=A0A507CY19_9FUNG|nr:hypothetical protein SeLEV6574_g04734 [Synchytrium endobioticum]TPX47828.1 hypothetical protein SeMB42_g03190 [Synchytrium endobioticum]
MRRARQINRLSLQLSSYRDAIHTSAIRREAVHVPPTNTSVETNSNNARNIARDKVAFPGAPASVYTETLSFLKSFPIIPTYRVLDTDGAVLVPSEEPNIPPSKLIQMYRTMLTINALDLVLYEAQRQGRISFYMTSYGEEATHLGSAAAISDSDVVFAQYREVGVLLHRNYPLSSIMNQCYGNDKDLGKGRQMPIHYGSREYNFQTISSPLGTQIPQAAGAAYALKMKKKHSNQGEEGNVVICYFGEGAASEGDFHAALNIAAVIGAPVLFFCRNNGYAISTPSNEQYRGDGIAARGHGYGIETVRVDGNDVLAVFNAVSAARQKALSESKPILVEALTYRVSHHSTSDDSSAYRSKKEVSDWQQMDSPTARFRKYLEKRGLWNEELEKTHKKTTRQDILQAFQEAEKRKKPAISDLFTDVYDQIPWHLLEQQRELQDIMAKKPETYDTTSHAASPPS